MMLNIFLFSYLPYRYLLWSICSNLLPILKIRLLSYCLVFTFFIYTEYKIWGICKYFLSVSGSPFHPLNISFCKVEGKKLVPALPVSHWGVFTTWYFTSGDLEWAEDCLLTFKAGLGETALTWRRLFKRTFFF